MLEVRAETAEAAATGQDIIQGFLTEPDTGAVYRSPLPPVFIPTSVLRQFGTDCICCIVMICAWVRNVHLCQWTHSQIA